MSTTRLIDDTERAPEAERSPAMIEAHLKRKAAELRRWLAETAPHVEREQRHLQEGAAERAYWHYGYYVAVRDMQAIIESSAKR